MSHKRIACLALFLVVSFALAAGKDATPPTPPSICGGFADANGTLGFFANTEGGIDAVDLATGQKRWSSNLGRWPLFSRFGWLAVAAIDEKVSATVKSSIPSAPSQVTREIKSGSLKIRFLKPADGSLISETPPLHLQVNSEAATDEFETSWGGTNGSLSLSAWSPLPSRGGGPRDIGAGTLQLRSVARSFTTSGIAPRQPISAPVTQILYINPMDGKVTKGPVKGAPAFGLAEPKLPKGWKKGKQSIYWNWSRWGSAWTDKPRPFRITSGVEGFFSCDQTKKKIILNRWRPLEPLAPVEIMEGTEHVALISLDSRYAILTSYVNGKDQYRLFDLYYPQKGGTDLPPYREGVQFFQQAVVGPILYYLTQTRGPENYISKTILNRNLVALDWKAGKVLWTYPLAPRYEYPPVAGAGPR